MSRRASTFTLTEICAFWGMVVAAITHFLGGLFHALVRLFDIGGILSSVANICQILGNVALIVAIALPAYQYVKYRTKGWRIFYVIALVMFILGVGLGIAII